MGPTAAERPVDLASGLSESDVTVLRARYGANVLPAPEEPSLGRRLAHHLLEPLSAVLVVAAAVSGFVLQHPGEGAAIAAIVILNVAIAVTQERRASSALRALERLTAPTARAARDGTWVTLPASQLVPDDVIDLAAGDRVPADVELLSAQSLAIDESMLTGEWQPAEKSETGLRSGDPGVLVAERTGEAFAGTLVVRGHAIGVVVRTGIATEMGAIASGLGTATTPPLVGQLRGVASRMSVLAIVLGVVLVPLSAARSSSDDRWVDAMLAGVALAVAAIPEGLLTIVTTALAMGARRLARRGAIVRRLPAIEALGAASVICSDKTGTLTTGQLTVSDHVAIPGRSQELWIAALRCNDSRDGIGDPVDVALAAAARGAGIDDSAQTLGERVASRPFDAASRSMVTVHALPAGSVTTVKGAPEVVVARCRASRELTALQADIDRLLATGARVLAFATAEAEDIDGVELDALGIVAFADPLRPSAADTVEACHRAGIRVVLVTGDHLVTASEIARRAGIPAGTPLTGHDVAEIDDPEERARALRAAGVIARVDPATKVALVDAHRAVGEVVAMTGDGVNDAPALRRADIGIALAGAGGTDVAREAASLVVTDGDLGTLVAAVREGRKIFRNLFAVVGYLIAGNLSEIIVVAGALLVFPEWSIVLLPVQLLWVNLVTDGLPAIALGVDDPPGDVLAVPPRPRGSRLLDGRRQLQLLAWALAVAVPTLGSAVIAEAAGHGSVHVRTQLLLSLLFGHLCLAYVARTERLTFERGWWRNPILFAAVAGSAGLQLVVFGTEWGRALLSVAALPPSGWLIAVAAGLASAVIIDAGRTVRRFLPARDLRP